MNETYVSIDVETDGPIPGPYSMLSLGAAAFSEEGRLLETFSANLQALPGASQHPDAMKWWQKHPEAWTACHRDPRPPEEVMPSFAAWLEALPGSPVFVAYPIAFDFMFVHWYLHRFNGKSPLPHNGIDVRTYAMAILKNDYRNSGKGHMPERWFSSHPHTHSALDDAIEQGYLFTNMLVEHRKSKD